MSCKGMSVTAGRTMVEELCGKRGLPLYILHDFDIAGFSIKQTLFTTTAATHSSTRSDRDRPRPAPRRHRVVRRPGPSARFRDGRLRRQQGLRHRPPAHQPGNAAEIEFLLRGAGKIGQRVELNAMTSDLFVAFVEGKLSEHRAAKMVSEAETLAELVGLKRGAMAKAEVAATLARINAVPVDVPADLQARVRAHLVKHPKATWDGALRAVVGRER